MAATVFGDGYWGTLDETGTDINLHTSGVALDITSNQSFMPNHAGNETGLAINNFGAGLSFSGFLSTASDLGVLLAEVLQAANIANSAIFGTSTATTVFYVIGGNITSSNAGFQEGSVETVGRDGLTDVTGTAIV